MRIIRPLSALAVAALVAGGLAATPGPSLAAAPAAADDAAAPTPVDDVDLTWQLNRESVSGAFAPGTWNLFSAGKIGDPGAGGRSLVTADEGATWNNGAAAGWSAVDGDVTVEDLAANGSYAPTTFQGTRTNSAGAPVTAVGANNVISENRVVFGGGTGTVDTEAGTASVEWDGDLTILFYSGMTFFYVSDPSLQVAADGTAELTATVGGYATSMEDMEQWDPLPDEEVVLADLEGVEVDADGFTVTPEYAGVEYEAPEEGTAQNRDNPGWGSFPQSFVDFAQVTGAGSYWYSSGGAADPRKPAAPLTVAWDAGAAPSVTVSDTTLLPSGAQEVTVTGSNFDPADAIATRRPLGPPAFDPGRPGGVYVVFGKFGPGWQPSGSNVGADRRIVEQKWAVLAEDMTTIGGTDRGAIELSPEGDFTTTFTIDKNAADTLHPTGDYGIYTYAGGGAVTASYETATPLTFAQATPAVTLTAPNTSYGQAARVVATVAGESDPTGAVTLTRGGARVGTAELVDGRTSFTLPRMLAAGSHRLALSYAGDLNTATGTASRTLSVAKARTSTRLGLVRKPTTRRGGQARVTVTSPSGAALAGRATLVLRTAGGRQVRRWTPSLRQGVATVPVPKLAKGGYRLVATWPGNANHQRPASTLLRFFVR